MTRKEGPTVGETAHPRVKYLEVLRVAAEVPSVVLARVLGNSRLTYYTWCYGKFNPRSTVIPDIQACTEALHRALNAGHLPVFRGRSLTAKARTAKIEETLTNYLRTVEEEFKTRPDLAQAVDRLWKEDLPEEPAAEPTDDPEEGVTEQ